MCICWCKENVLWSTDYLVMHCSTSNVGRALRCVLLPMCHICPEEQREGREVPPLLVSNSSWNDRAPPLLQDWE